MQFPSKKDAAKFMGYPTDKTTLIDFAIRQGTRCPKGYFWRYKDDKDDRKEFEVLDGIEGEKSRAWADGTFGKKNRPVVRLTDGKTYPSMKIAARWNDIPNPNGITMAIKRNIRCKGHKWAYADDSTA